MTDQPIHQQRPTWLGALFVSVPAEHLRAVLERLGIVVDFLLVVGVLVIGDRSAASIAGACFLAFAAVLRAFAGRLRDPLLSLFWLWSLLFIEFPCTCVAAMPSRFPVDHGLEVELSAPDPAAIAWALAQLSCCYLAVTAAAVVLPTRPSAPWPRIRPRPAIVVSLAMLGIGILYDRFRSVLPGLEYPAVRSAFEVIKTVSYDSAIVTFWVAAFATWTPGSATRSNSRMLAFAVACAAFLAVHTYNSSKGAILVLVFLAVGVPLALAIRCPGALMIVPRRRTLVVVAITALPIFGFAESLRAERKLGREGAADAAPGIVERLSSGKLIESAAIRLSVSYLRYLAIFDRFCMLEPGDRDGPRRNAAYTGRSLVNLLAPGTPFPDTYAPSSMVIDDLLSGSPLEGPQRDDLRGRRNSQPTTAFGFLFVIFGWWAPVITLLATLALRIIFVSGGFVSACLSAALIQGALSCYGMDAAVQTSIAFAATIGVLMLMSRIAPAGRHGSRETDLATVKPVIR